MVKNYIDLEVQSRTMEGHFPLPPIRSSWDGGGRKEEKEENAEGGDEREGEREFVAGLPPPDPKPPPLAPPTSLRWVLLTPKERVGASLLESEQMNK